MKLRQQRGLELPYTGGLRTEHDLSPTKKDEKHGKLDDPSRLRDPGSAKSQRKQVNVLQQQMLPYIKYKTKLCRHYTQSQTCALGDACSFAHGHKELRKSDDPAPQNFPGLDYVGAVHSNYKTQLCRNFEINGMCSFGNLCCFAHGQDQLRTLTQPMPPIPQEVLIYGPPKMRLSEKNITIMPSV